MCIQTFECSELSLLEEENGEDRHFCFLVFTLSLLPHSSTYSFLNSKGCLCWDLTPGNLLALAVNMEQDRCTFACNYYFLLLLSSRLRPVTEKPLHLSNPRASAGRPALSTGPRPPGSPGKKQSPPLNPSEQKGELQNKHLRLPLIPLYPG